MTVVAFRDSAGRSLSDAIVGIVAAPGEFHDIAMVTDVHGEIRFTPTQFGDYEFGVHVGGQSRTVVVRITSADARLTVAVT